MQTALPMDPVGGESMTQDDSAMATQNPSATGLELEVRHLIRELFYFNSQMVAHRVLAPPPAEKG